MALTDTFQPFTFYFEIPQGAHFHLEFPPFLDATTGQPFDFTADPAGAWIGRLEVRDSDDQLLAAFATSGETGVMTLGADGVVTLDLSAAASSALPATTNSAGSPPGAPVFAQLLLTDPTDNEPWCWGNGRGRIRKQVTSA